MYFQPFIGYNPPISYRLSAHKEPPILIRRISFVTQVLTHRLCCELSAWWLHAMGWLRPFRIKGFVFPPSSAELGPMIFRIDETKNSCDLPMLPVIFWGVPVGFQVKNQLLLAKQHICQAFHKGPHTRYLFFVIKNMVFLVHV